jgi:hypothetical protein
MQKLKTSWYTIFLAFGNVKFMKHFDQNGINEHHKIVSFCKHSLICVCMSIDREKFYDITCHSAL